MGKSKKKFKTARNWNAVDAHFRNSAGAMKDRRDGRSGATNTSRDYLSDYFLEVRDCDLEYLGEDCSDDNGYSDHNDNGNFDS